MKLICEFDRAQYLTGQEVRLSLPEGVNAPRVCVYRLETPVDCSVRQSGRTLILPPLPTGSYGVAVETGSAQWEGAFDVVEDSRQVTRYAFLSDFTSADTETQDVDWLRRLHFNAVQFYDWMYRHDMLLPPQERYLDPMGRETDLAAIRAKIAACKAAGIRPIAYGAVYAAAKELFAEHPEWAMYTMDGQAMTFAGWLYYMNIAPSCGWSEHILAEFRKAVAFGFSGIHMDTYGFPKQVWDAERRPVELTDALPKLIDRAAEAVRKEDSAAGVIFNAVNNWPMEAVAGTRQDAVYIEVWPPNDRYYDLYTLIREARLCSGKQVVLAAYLHPFQQADTDGAERAFRLSWAAISAAGGTQLVLGENKAALQDSYYANYASLRASFLPVVQRYCDFLVRYAALLYLDAGMDIGRTAAGGINEDIQFEAEDCVYMLSDDRKETDSPFAGIQDMITCEYKEPEGWINQSRYLKTGASGKGSLWCLEEFQSGKNVYFKFKVSVPADGNYTIKARAQTVGERDISGKFAINVNNEKNADGTLKFHTETEKQMCAPCNQLELYCPNNADVKEFTNYCNSFWWDSITVGTVSMKKGENEIRIYLPTGFPGNLDFFEVVSGKAVQEAKVISVRSGSVVDLSKNALYLKKGEKLTDIVDTPERHPVKYTLLYIRTTSGKEVCVLNTMLEGKIDYDKVGEQTITVTDPVSGESASFKLIIES